MFRIVIPAIVAATLGVAVAPIGAFPAFAQGSSSEAADTMFWDSVKTSKDPAEIRAYLDKFPNGMFAPLARIRLRNLEGGKASAPAPRAQPSAPLPQQTPPTFSQSPRTAPSSSDDTPSASHTPSTSRPYTPSSTASALTSSTVIREVQDRLYNLNYQIGVRNGRLTEDTRKAIRQWQENVKVTPTGDMTESQLIRLRSARVPTVWGAVAYYSKGATATVWNRPTREAAEREALAACRKNAGATCSVLTVANKICGAVGFYNAVISGRQHWGAYVSVRPTLGQATDHAMSECRRQAKQPNGCGVRATVCADGGHRR